MSLAVAVFVGTRADLGPLGPVLEAVVAAPDLELHLLTGVAFSAESLWEALPPAGRPAREAVHALTDATQDAEAADMLRQGPALSLGLASLLPELRPDVCVLLGDRWELLWVASALYLAQVPVVHVHGGEVTEGALDDRVRHAVTKLADQHCAASEDAAARIRQMGEPADRVHVTGAPGLDRLQSTAPLRRDELSELLGRDAPPPLVVFTYHPYAAAGQRAGQWAQEALQATLDSIDGGTVLATHPGMDAGRHSVIDALEGVAAVDPRVVVVEALGADFPRVLATADLVVGNSSSGVIEAASLGLPAVDVGDRQKGRLRGANVVHAEEGRASVADAVSRALAPDFRALSKQVDNPYGNGGAAARIVDVVRVSADLARSKQFVSEGSP